MAHICRFFVVLLALSAVSVPPAGARPPASEATSAPLAFGLPQTCGAAAAWAVGTAGQAAPCDIASQVGAFTPDQRLLFGGVAMTVDEAMQTQQPTVTVVAAGSTPDHLTFEEAAITAFACRPYAGAVMRIETWDGDALRVIASHGIVTASGELVAAEHVHPEMALLAEAGVTRVMQTWQSPYAGPVWHVGTAGDKGGQPHVLVSEHLLTGAFVAPRSPLSG